MHLPATEEARASLVDGDAGGLHHAARRELDRLLRTPLRRRLERVAYRDTLMVLLLSACPVRLLNLSGLRIGQQIRQEAGRWVILLDEPSTKNSQRLNYLLPRHLGDYLSVYLERVRPSFGPVEGETALWLGFEGGPLTAHSIYGRIVQVTERLEPARRCDVAVAAAGRARAVLAARVALRL